MAAAGGPTETGAAANGVSPSIPLRHVKVAVIGVGGLFHECLVDWVSSTICASTTGMTNRPTSKLDSRMAQSTNTTTILLSPKRSSTS